jgi:hypothetical protein
MARRPALATWWKELRAGMRTLTTFDPLWRAACAELNGDDRAAADVLRRAALLAGTGLDALTTATPPRDVEAGLAHVAQLIEEAPTHRRAQLRRAAVLQLADAGWPDAGDRVAAAIGSHATAEASR